MARYVHVTTLVIDHRHLVATFNARLHQTPRGVKVLIRGQYPNLHF